MIATPHTKREVRASTEDQLREVDRIMVTRIVIAEGDGESNDPVRLVTYLYDDNGMRLARTDPIGEIIKEQP